MKKYEILEHKADLNLRIFGKNKKELFENAMIGMFEAGKYQADPHSVSVQREISVNSPELDLLLADFLSEVLYLTETKKEIYFKVNFRKFSSNHLEAILQGKKLKNMGIIKAVTYHNLKITQRENGYLEAEVLFDI